MSTNVAATPPAADLETEILNVLRAAPEPVAATKIRAALSGRKRPPVEELTAALESLADQGRIQRFAPYRTQMQAPRFWDRSHHEYARQVIRAVLEGKTRSANDLDKAIEKPLADLTKAQRREAVAALVAARAVYELPGVGASKTVRYSLAPPDPADYLRAAMNRFLKQEEKVRRQLAPLGIEPGQVREAALRLLEAGAPAHPHAKRQAHALESALETSPPQPAIARPASDAAGNEEQARILAKIEELGRDPRLGGFVSVADLRRSLEGQIAEKERFDAAVLELAHRRRIDLYPHDYPGSLTEEECGQLVPDGRGGVFNGVSLRRGT